MYSAEIVELRQEVELNEESLLNYQKKMFELRMEDNVLALKMNIARAEYCLKDLSMLISMQQDQVITYAAQRNFEEIRIFIAHCLVLRSRLDADYMRISARHDLGYNFSCTDLLLEIPTFPKIYSELKPYRIGIL